MLIAGRGVFNSGCIDDGSLTWISRKESTHVQRALQVMNAPDIACWNSSVPSGIDGLNLEA